MLGCACLAVIGPASVAMAQLAPALQPVPGERQLSGRLVVRPIEPESARRRGMDAVAAERRARQARALVASMAVERRVAEVDEYVVKVPDGEDDLQAAQRMVSTGNFEYVEPDWIVFPIGCPDDSFFALQWHHAANRLDSCSAWGLDTGSSDVVVAICDTGILASHQDLLLHRREGFHVPSQTWEGDGGPVSDINGHGTACTGSAAGNGNNGLGIAGMGWNLGHRMLRVTDWSDGSAYLSDLTFAARFAADQGDKVVSVSYSGVDSASVATAGSYVRSKGSLLFWAAGNSATSLSGSREDSVIVVGATDRSDGRASFSNYGPLVDLFAPGVDIATTHWTGPTSYAYASGTSFACPVTAGLCALIWSRNPSLTPAEVESILRESCTDLGTAGVDSTFGYGRIDAGAALAITPSRLLLDPRRAVPWSRSRGPGSLARRRSRSATARSRRFR
jgi:subtilisin family serine protease